MKKTLPFGDKKSHNSQNNSENQIQKSNSQTQKSAGEKLLWQQIQLIYTFLQKPNSWYTGIAIKKWLKKNILINTKNHQINASRWSAYCHFSQAQSFCNLLDKFQLIANSQILIHPLLPDFLVEELIKRGFKITSFDIDKNHLNWRVGDLTEFLKNRNIDLVIFYSFNGLVEEIEASLSILSSKVVSSLVVIDNDKLNHKTLELFEKLNLGGVLYFGGLNLWTPFLNQVLDSKIAQQNWYFSWFLETRTRSILENHLSQSQEINQKLVESFFYLLVQKWQKQSLSNYFSGLFKGILLKNKIKNDQEALQIISQNWSKSLEFAVSDLVFEMELEIKKSTNLPINSPHNIPKIQPKAQNWQQYFANSIPKRPSGSLQVPVFFTLRNYLCYFIFTTEKDFWQDFLLQNYKLKYSEFFFQLQPISPIIAQLNLPNATFIQKYLLVIKLD